ncbi:hypothetical protein [Defluviimonas sp. SAOS-178_SWC]|uniref:hypothetical protein n=1 Tax=Defluviimonas sp. SAOS-178_SWC TaxID=3121287 RepID=UPI003221AF4B
MTRHLDPPLTIGGVRLWALCESQATGWALPGGAGFAASKRPLAVICDNGTTVAAFDPTGRALSPDDLEALCPGLRDRIVESRDEVRG